MEIKIQLTDHPKQKPTDQTKLGFGHCFTDHMFLMDYHEDRAGMIPELCLMAQFRWILRQAAFIMPRKFLKE